MEGEGASLARFRAAPSASLAFAPPPARPCARAAPPDFAARATAPAAVALAADLAAARDATTAPAAEARAHGASDAHATLVDAARYAALLPTDTKRWKVRWTSPLLGKGSAKARTLYAERCMAIASHAGALAAAASERLAEADEAALGGGGDAGARERAAAAEKEGALLLRRAAGAWEAAATAVDAAESDETGEPIAMGAERPAELYAPVCRALGAVALADAQTAVACSAERRGTSDALVAKLYRGAATSCLETAPAALLHYLRAAQALSGARSRRRMAMALLAEEGTAPKTGEALSLMRKSEAKVEAAAEDLRANCPSSAASAGSARWSAALTAERAAVARLLEHCERENSIMLCAVPPQPLAVDAKVLARAVAYEDSEEPDPPPRP
eukprot:PRCOL_00006611-RA